MTSFFYIKRSKKEMNIENKSNEKYPCDYSYEFLDHHPQMVDEGGLCKAYKKNIRTERCGEPASEHPHDFQSSNYSIYLFLLLLSYEKKNKLIFLLFFYLIILVEPWLVMFSILPQWKDILTPDLEYFASEFPTKPSYDQLYSKCQEIFELNAVDIFTSYCMHGVLNEKEFLITAKNFVIVRGVEVRLIPRYHTYEFHIVTLSIRNSRKEVIKYCKQYCIAGSVTRDNPTSLLVSLHHPDREYLNNFIQTNLKSWLNGYRGYIDQERMIHKICHGTLKNIIRSHTGTARRNDGIDSWHDEEGKSGSTYFNAPLKSKVKEKGEYIE